MKIYHCTLVGIFYLLEYLAQTHRPVHCIVAIVIYHCSHCINFYISVSFPIASKLEVQDACDHDLQTLCHFEKRAAEFKGIHSEVWLVNIFTQDKGVVWLPMPYSYAGHKHRY